MPVYPGTEIRPEFWESGGPGGDNDTYDVGLPRRGKEKGGRRGSIDHPIALKDRYCAREPVER